MTRSTKCPPPEQWKKLLEDVVSERQQSELQNHLEDCDRCRETLEELVADRQSWAAATSGLAELSHQAAPENALKRVMAEAKAQMAFPSTHGDSSSPDNLLLDFLGPSENPDHVGTLGPYEIIEVIGRGGMGVVFKGHDPRLNRFVAIKVLAPELASNANARKRFQREGQAAAAVSHDHVVTIHAVDEAGGLPHLAMEYISGHSLEDRIKTNGPLELKEILRIGMQTAAGLAAAHGQGLVHRDIKPANILLENGVERVKITDFGLARAVDDVRITKPGVVTGTPEYMSPEQARGESVDHRSDLFSLGCVMYAICTGRPPFRADNTMAMIHRMCKDTPRPIQEINNEIPDWLVEVIDKLLAKDTAERFQSAAEVADLLGQCLAHVQQPAAAPLPPLPDRPSASGRRNVPIHRRPWVAAAAGILVLLGGLGFTEATGVTDVAGIVIRIVRGDGTLVIEVDDPDVSVSIDDGEVVITGAGAKEIRLATGQYQVQAVKDGKLVHTELVTVTRGGRQVVKVTLESQQPKGSRGLVTRRVWAHRFLEGLWSPSPDGRYLAFRDKFTGNLLVRDLVTGENRRLTNSESTFAHYTTEAKISHDGKWIAYGWRNRKERTCELRIIGVDGSQPRTLYRHEEVENLAPADWSRDGKYVLASFRRTDESRQIVMVSVADGSVRVLQSPARIANMRLSPDGRYVARSLRPEEDSTHRDIFLLTTDGSGEEWAVVEGPADDGMRGWAPDGKRLLFSSDRAGSMDLWAIQIADGKPQRAPQLIMKNFAPYAYEGPTRKGALYYTIRANMRGVHLATLDPATGKVLTPPKQISQGGGFSPAWSPDGKYLAYLLRRDHSWIIGIQSTETGKERELSLSRDVQPYRFGRAASLGWSPDGRFLVFAGQDQKRRDGIYQIDAQTGTDTLIVKARKEKEELSGPMWSPDGKAILYRHELNLVVRNLETGQEVDVCRRETRGFFRYAWSPDGKAVYYRVVDLDLDARTVKSSRLFARNLATGEQKEIHHIDAPQMLGGWALSPDGRRLAFLSGVIGARGGTTLKVIPTKGGQPRELARVQKPEVFRAPVAWTPDGRYLLFGKGRFSEEAVQEPPIEMWRISAEGGQPQKLGLAMDEWPSALRIHPDGRQIAFTARQQIDELWVMENFLPPLKVAK